MDGLTTQPVASVTHGRTSSTLALIRSWLMRGAGVAAAGMSRAAINRRVVRQLSVMSDRELRDIGLVRQDVLDSEMLLLEGDASSFLVGRRDERRAGRRVPRGHWPPRRI
ncbi:DUF1127 domain-containing protein [Methylobacterium sp. M6A4_1b]